MIKVADMNGVSMHLSHRTTTTSRIAHMMSVQEGEGDHNDLTM